MRALTSMGKEITLRPLKDRLIVRHMVRPEVQGSIVLPDKAYRQDRTNTLWDVLWVTREAGRAMNHAVDPGDILVTQRRWPVDLGLTDLEGYPIFAMGASTAGLRNIIKNTWDENRPTVATPVEPHSAEERL